MASSVLSGPTRLERWLTLTGALAVPFVLALWALQPAAPPTKGVGAGAVQPETWLALGAGVLLMLGTARSVWSGWQARRWQTAPGEITEVRSVGVPYLFVAGRYAVGEAEHRVVAIRYGIERWATAYRTGQPVDVRYDPEAPSVARLQPVVSPAGAIALLVGVVLAVGSLVGLALGA